MKKTLALAAVAAAIVPATSIAVAQGAPSDAQARDATAASPTLTVRTTRFGKILFAGNGRALYGFTATGATARAGVTGTARQRGPSTSPRGR
jgi:predicted lipoprotein with Yx(FWY)xxD motif